MAKHSDARKPKAETPKGFRDYFGAEVAERNAMLAKISQVYELYGFDALETSAVETVEALGKFLPDVDRPNEGVFAWLEDTDWLALRYDLTAPLARVYAQHRQDLPTPYRRYAMGPVWRNEKPGLGRFRQFYQCDADTVGAASVAADAEICAMLADVLEKVGIARGDYVVKVTNRKVNGIVESVANQQAARTFKSGLSPQGKVALEQTIQQITDKMDDILRTLDKFDKVGAAGVSELLGAGRLDQSGAFIPGLSLPHYVIEGLLAFLHARGRDNAETISNLREVVSRSERGMEGVKELEVIAELLAAQGYGPDRIVIDPSVVRGLGYYTGPVYEAELTFPITDDKGRKQQFGSVAGGGRYDDLVKRFTGQEVPATGVSIGVDRLLAALRLNKKSMEHPKHSLTGPVVVTVMDRDRMADYQSMVSELRISAIRAEVYLGNPKQFGNQLKYADKRGSPAAVIQGADELARGVVKIKDMILGSALDDDVSVEEWKNRPNEYEVPRGELVARVQAILDAQK